MRAMTIIDWPSPNFDERALPVSMIVLHYTGMPDAEGAIDRLTQPRGQGLGPLLRRRGRRRSCAWSTRSKRAWHAGKRYWRGITDVNSASVGIEIVNPGHEFGYRPFPDEQIAALIPLVADIKERHGIGRGNVVGHSDIAPARKEDPGELFPWGALAKRRLALPSPTRDLMDPYWTDAGFLLALERFGYDVTDPLKAAIAFQRRFRPDLHRRHHRRRMPRQAARALAAAARNRAISRRARGPGGRGSAQVRARKVRAPRNDGAG